MVWEDMVTVFEWGVIFVWVCLLGVGFLVSCWALNVSRCLIMSRSMVRDGHTLCVWCRWLYSVRPQSVLSLKMWRLWHQMRLWYVPCEESESCGRLCIVWTVEWKWRKEERWWRGRWRWKKKKEELLLRRCYPVLEFVLTNGPLVTIIIPVFSFLQGNYVRLCQLHCGWLPYWFFCKVREFVT